MNRSTSDDRIFLEALEAARNAAKAAYCPFSGYRVGASAVAQGRIFTGCNIENASFGLTICAERAALFAAVSAGVRCIELLAVSCIDALPTSPEPTKMPCGACRQVMAEFASPSLVIVVDGVGEFSLSQLLPAAFVLKLGPGNGATQEGTR